MYKVLTEWYTKGFIYHGILLDNSKAFKQQVRCYQKGLQRLREFVLS